MRVPCKQQVSISIYLSNLKNAKLFAISWIEQALVGSLYWPADVTLRSFLFGNGFGRFGVRRYFAAQTRWRHGAHHGSRDRLGWAEMRNNNCYLVMRLWVPHTKLNYQFNVVNCSGKSWTVLPNENVGVWLSEWNYVHSWDRQIRPSNWRPLGHFQSSLHVQRVLEKSWHSKNFLQQFSKNRPWDHVCGRRRRQADVWIASDGRDGVALSGKADVRRHLAVQVKMVHGRQRSEKSLRHVVVDLSDAVQQRAARVRQIEGHQGTNRIILRTRWVEELDN